MDITLKNIEIGKKIEVIFANVPSENGKGSFISQFVSVNVGKIIILAPITNENNVQIRKNAILLVYFIYKCDLYRFKAVVLGKYKSEGLAVLEIKKTHNFEKIQRREFYRFDTILDVIYKFDDGVDDKWRKGIIKDISGGGVCIVAKENVKKNSKLECIATLKDGNKIKFIGKVVRVDEELNIGRKKKLGISFYKISNKEREVLIRYIFIEQRKLRKKGLI